MRVDRPANKTLTGVSANKTPGTTLQKKGNKLNLNAGDEDKIQISQSQNSLKIRVNEDPVQTLSPEESRNFHVTGNLENISVDSTVTLPIKGLSVETKPETPLKEGAGRKDERAFTGQMTREILVSELKNYMAEQGDVTTSKNVSQEAPPKEQIALNLNILRAPDAGSESPRSPESHEDVAKTNEFMPIAAEVKEQSSLTATIKKNDLSSELGITSEQQEKIDTGSDAAMVLPQEPVALKALPLQRSFVKGELLQVMEGKVLPEEAKAKLLEGLAGETKFSVLEERGIHSLLSTVSNEKEFRAILPDFPAFQVGRALRDPEMKTSWDRLVAGFNREELALNPHEAAPFAGLFSQPPETLERLAPGCISRFLTKEAAGEPLHFLDHPSFICLVLENRSREIHNQPFVNAADLRQNALEILTDGSLSGEEKFGRLHLLKEESGLTDFQMREIVTRPLSSFLQIAIHDASQERDTAGHTMETKVREALDAFGPESVAVEITKAEHQEILDHLDSRVQRLTDFQITADAIFSGPHDPLVKADRVLESALNVFFPAQQTVEPEINQIFNAAVSFQAGKLDYALARIIPSFAPELKPFVQPASIFIQGIRNGMFPSLLMQLSSHPAIARESSVPQFVASAKFLAQLATGTFARQMQSTSDVLKESVPAPLQEVFSQVQRWRSNVAISDGSKTRQDLMSEAGPLQRELFTALQSNLPSLVQKATEVLDDPRFRTAMETVKAGSEAMIAFRNGHLAQILTALNQRIAGNAAVKQLIEQALHITNAGTPFFRGLFNREWERPVFTALKKGSSSKELQEVPGIFSDALNLFLPLTSVEDSSPFLQYQRQLSYLKDEELMADWIHQYLKSYI